nr:hypothetical protein [Tanacetum cinerariifolium]
MSKDSYAYVVAAFQALPLPDYVPGPEEPKQVPPSPVYIPYVPESVYPDPYEGRSGDVSPGVDGPPVMSKDSYAYVVAAFQALPLPDYVPGPEEPKQ